MIDWFSGYVGYDASSLRLGRVFEVAPGGEVLRERDRWETAVGSWETGVQVGRTEATVPMLEAARDLGFRCSPSVLRVSGNPVKFLQGHNAAGPSVSLLGPVVRAMVDAFSEGLRPPDAGHPVLPAVHRTRVDVTTAVDMGSHEAVHEWLECASVYTRSRHGRAVSSGSTVYWGKNSTRWSLKAYCKHCELKEHPPAAVHLVQDLLEWTRPHLRIELCLRRPELKDRGTLGEPIIWEFFSKLELQAMKQRVYAPENLRPALRMAFQNWLTGIDLKSMVPTRTFYRYRKEILDAMKIDIALPAATQRDSSPQSVFSLEELRAREVHDTPTRIQRSLFGAGL